MKKPSKRAIAGVLGCTERHFHRIFDGKYTPREWAHIPASELHGYKAQFLKELQRGAWLHLNGTESVREEIDAALSTESSVFGRMFALQKIGQKYQAHFDFLGRDACKALKLPIIEEEL